MINVSGNLWVPSEGYQYLSDGTTWTDSIYLGKGHDITRWHDTNDGPPEAPQELRAEEVLDILLGGGEA